VPTAAITSGWGRGACAAPPIRRREPLGLRYVRRRPANQSDSLLCAIGGIRRLGNLGAGVAAGGLRQGAVGAGVDWRVRGSRVACASCWSIPCRAASVRMIT